jgi:tRNA dimethylallyltransferase
VIVAGGSGLYVKALTHGLSRVPAADPKLRAQLNDLSLDELCGQLLQIDPEIAGQVDLKNRRRVARALEICLLSGKPLSAQRTEWKRELRGATPPVTNGVFVFRERAELYKRIDRRVEEMFADGVVEEVRALPELGSTAEKTLGLREIRALLAGQISGAECVAKIQQATRRYAKRQLTWFQRQDNFEPLNLSSHDSSRVIDLIAQNARLVFAQKDD